MKAIRDRFAELRGSMPTSIPDAEIMEMAEQDVEFERQWLDFQKENPLFQDYRLEPDDGAGRDPAWLKLQAEHPRFLMHRPVPKMAPGGKEIECLADKNLAADVAAGAALGLALSRARAGKKTSLRMLENAHLAMARTLQIVAAGVLIFVAALIGFQAGQESVFDQLPAGQAQEIRERIDNFFQQSGEQK